MGPSPEAASKNEGNMTIPSARSSLCVACGRPRTFARRTSKPPKGTARCGLCQARRDLGLGAARANATPPPPDSAEAFERNERARDALFRTLWDHSEEITLLVSALDRLGVMPWATLEALAENNQVYVASKPPRMYLRSHARARFASGGFESGKRR